MERRYLRFLSCGGGPSLLASYWFTTNWPVVYNGNGGKTGQNTGVRYNVKHLVFQHFSHKSDYRRSAFEDRARTPVGSHFRLANLGWNIPSPPSASYSDLRIRGKLVNTAKAGHSDGLESDCTLKEGTGHDIHAYSDRTLSALQRKRVHRTGGGHAQ